MRILLPLLLLLLLLSPRADAPAAWIIRSSSCRGCFISSTIKGVLSEKMLGESEFPQASSPMTLDPVCVCVCVYVYVCVCVCVVCVCVFIMEKGRKKCKNRGKMNRKRNRKKKKKN